MCICVLVYVHMKMCVCMNLKATSGLLSIYTDVVIYEYFVCSLQSRCFPQILGKDLEKPDLLAVALWSVELQRRPNFHNNHFKK